MEILFIVFGYSELIGPRGGIDAYINHWIEGLKGRDGFL